MRIRNEALHQLLYETKFEYAKNKKDEIFTLVRGLSGMLHDEFYIETMDKINDTVPLITKSIKLGSLHLHFCLFELVKYGTIQEIEQEFLAKFNSSKYFGPMKKTRIRCRYEINERFEYYMLAHDVRPPELSNCTQVHTFAVQEYERNFKTNIKTHAWNRTKRLFDYYSGVEKDKYNTLEYLFDKDSDIVPNAYVLSLLRTYDEVLKPLTKITPEEKIRREIENESVIPRGWLSTLKDDKEWYRHAYEFINLLQWFYHHNIEEPYFQKKLFIAIPQSKIQNHFVTIDTTALIEITNSFQEKGKKTNIRSLEDGLNAPGFKDSFWRKFFKIDELNCGRQYFDFSVNTNGVAAHFKMKKRKLWKPIMKFRSDALPPISSNIWDTHEVQIFQYNSSATNTGPNRKAKNKKKGEKGNLTRGVLSNGRPNPKYARMTDSMRIRWANKRYRYLIGFDPGYKLPVAIVRQQCATKNEENLTIHWKEFRKRCGDPRRKKKLHRLTGWYEDLARSVRENRDIYPEQPSPKSPDYDTYIDYQMRTFNIGCAVSELIFFISKNLS